MAGTFAGSCLRRRAEVLEQLASVELLRGAEGENEEEVEA
jgi:hypothetical protein